MLNKNTIPDSSNREEHFKKYGFYIENSRYYTFTYKNHTRFELLLSNFVGQSLYHLLNRTNNSKRILKIQRNTGEHYIVEIYSSEMKLESFETILKSQQCTFFGNTIHLKQIFAQWMDDETQAYIIETLGYNLEHNIYAFSNAIYTSNGKLLRVSDEGIINDAENKKNYYLPAFGLAQKNNQDYENERKFLYQEGELNFSEWAALYFQTFEANGGIAILFLILSVFWDIVFSQVGFFPFLFLFGAYGTGKTKLAEFLLRVLGKDYVGIPLNNATQVALSRMVASRNNSIFYLKEYTPETDDANQDFLLTAYDGSGRATGIKSNDNRFKVALTRSAIILDGNHLPTQRNAVLSRMLLLIFEKDQFDEKQINSFEKLKAIQEEGLGKVLTDILQHREFFKKQFKQAFESNLTELRDISDFDFAERTLKHVALILTPAKVLCEKLQFPFSFADITTVVVNNAIRQNQLLKECDEVTQFWQAFAYGVKNNILVEFCKEFNNRKNSHYNVKNDKTLLQIKLQDIYPEYVKYGRANNLTTLDINSLRMLLTSKSNRTFIPNPQKGRGAAYTDYQFGSCYQFHIQRDEKGYSINEVELNV